MTSFRWDLALTKLSQRLPDISEQSDILPLRAQQVRSGLCVHMHQYACDVVKLRVDRGLNRWWV